MHVVEALGHACSEDLLLGWGCGHQERLGPHVRGRSLHAALSPLRLLYVDAYYLQRG
jgi:hypothetical protein